MSQKTQEAIMAECSALQTLLLAKNHAYGDSALNPQRVFSQTDSVEQIAVRIDDKLSRIKNKGGLVKVLSSADESDEDTVQDLLGYLILARIAGAKKTLGGP